MQDVVKLTVNCRWEVVSTFASQVRIVDDGILCKNSACEPQD